MRLTWSETRSRPAVPAEPRSRDEELEALHEEAAAAQHAARLARREASLLVPLHRRIAALETEVALMAAGAEAAELTAARLRARERELDRREVDLAVREARLERMGASLREREEALSRAEAAAQR